MQQYYLLNIYAKSIIIVIIKYAILNKGIHTALINIFGHVIVKDVLKNNRGEYGKQQLLAILKKSYQ